MEKYYLTLCTVMFLALLYTNAKKNAIKQKLAEAEMREEDLRKHKFVLDEPLRGACEYVCEHEPYGATVYQTNSVYPLIRKAVKSFFCPDDVEYARLCAQELCDKLNEEI